MPQIPRDSVASILKALVVTEDEMLRLAKTETSREYHGGRVSGLRTALEVLAMDEDEVLPKVDQSATSN